MFKKKQLDLENMTADEMQAFQSQIVRRLLWVNGLWLVFVIFMLFWKTGIGIVLLVLTAVKFFFDYHDVESQRRFADFQYRSIRKRLTGGREDS